MKKSTITMACLFLLFILIGAGCGGQEEKQAQKSSIVTTTQPAVIKKPDSQESTFNQAMDFCEKQGYTVVFRFDEETKTNAMYCAFNEKIGCEIYDFYTGRCKASTSIQISEGELELKNIRTCDPQEHPVCGVDGNTYINVCIANLQKVQIVSDGPCEQIEDEEDTKITQTTSQDFDKTTQDSSSQTKKTTQIKSTTDSAEEQLSWINNLAKLLSKNANSSIEKCVQQEKTLYYAQESCPECFSTLYDEDGTIVCFPHNDLVDSCPSYFDKDDRALCSVIWRN